MALYEFRRADGSGSIRFDSSPEGSICRQYGFVEGTFSVTPDGEDRLRTYSRVFASRLESADPPKAGKPAYVGRMATLKPNGMELGRWCPVWPDSKR